MTDTAAAALLIVAISGALLMAVVLYFLPVIIAVRAQHPQAGAIAVVVNVCLGWTLIGWVAALAWALTQRPAQPSLPRH